MTHARVDASALHALDVPAFAEHLGVSRSYTWLLISQGRIKTIKIGRRRLVPSSELARLLGEAA